MRGRIGQLSLATGIAIAVAAGPAWGHHPRQNYSFDPVDGPVLADDGSKGGHQHGGHQNHLPASSENVALVSKLKLTNVQNGIADVAAHGDYAYLNASASECAGRPGAQGTGVHVVDISSPSSPRKVGFLPTEVNSYVGEGIHVIDFEDRDILVHNNETCDAGQPVMSGIGVWDVTNPRAPRKLGTFGDTTPAVALQQFHTTHSVQAFTWRGKAYAVAQDNQDLQDIDIFDLTPAVRGTGPAVLVSEVGLENWAGAQGSYGNGQSVFHHDMQQKVIDGHNMLAASYWDAGQVLLNIDNPANPVFVTDSDFATPDPIFDAFTLAEGNSHQSYWSRDASYLISTDEDFSASRTLFESTSGASAGQYGAGTFSWAKPMPPGGISGRTVYGGSGCVEDVNGNGVSDRAEIPSSSATGANTVVLTRGVCFFSIKVESGQMAGYENVIVANSHGGTRNGLLPDAFICGSQGHAFTPTAVGVCIGHELAHRLFDDAPNFTGPDNAAGGDMPAIGTLGATFRASNVFDGWGYVHLHDGRTLAELDTYVIPEAADPAFASGFGDLTVHEVKTDPRAKKELAYFSWYAAGARIASFEGGQLTEVGHFIDEGGNDFWGVFPHCVGQCLLNDRDQGRGRHNEKRPLVLLSDRDYGLYMIRYTGLE